MKKQTIFSIFMGGMLMLASINPSLAKPSDQVVGLDDIVVTSKQVNKELMEVPAAVSVITSTEIQEQGHNELVKFLKTVPGLHVGIDASGSSFFIRGQQVPGGEGVMIYINGRKAIYSGNAGSGITQGHKLDDLPIEMIESIEVIKAPPASIYGAGAAHGIIHIHTKKPQKGESNLNGSLSASYGSWQTAKANMLLMGATDKIDYSVNFNAKNAEGFRHTDKKAYTGEVNLGFLLNEENHIGITAGINKTDRKYPPSFKSKTDLEANRNSDRIRVPAIPGYGPRPGQPAGYNYPTEAESSLFYGSIDYQGTLRDIQISSVINLTRVEDDIFSPGTVYDNGTAEPDETDDRTNDVIQYNLTIKKEIFTQGNWKDSITSGLDYEYFKYNNAKIPAAGGTEVKTKSRRYGIFINNDLSHGKFSLLTGIRMDHMDWDLENGNSDAYDDSYKKTSWDIAPSYKATENMRIFYSLSHSYWFPNAFILSMPSWFENTDNPPTPEGQVPEKNLTHELGIKHLLSRSFNYSITLYHTATENKYMAPWDGTTGMGFTGFKPVGNATSKGVEFAIDGSLADWLTYRGSLSYTDATWDNGTLTGPKMRRKNLSGKQLANVPTWEYATGVTIFPMKNLSWAMDMTYEKDSYADDSNKTPQGSYLTVDTKLSYRHSEALSLYVLCTNLFDREYNKEYSSGMSGTYYDPRPGRYMEIGVTYQF